MPRLPRGCSAVGQAGRLGEGRAPAPLQPLVLMASACLDHDPIDHSQDPDRRMFCLHENEGEHRARLVTLMCCMGQYSFSLADHSCQCLRNIRNSLKQLCDPQRGSLKGWSGVCVVRCVVKTELVCFIPMFCCAGGRRREQ